jgi:hypothetical protein
MFIGLSQQALGIAFANMVFRNGTKDWRTDAASAVARDATLK